MEFTVIGDVVNVAQRLEEMTRKYNTDVTVSARLLDGAIPDGTSLAAWEALRNIRLRGRGQPLQTFALSRQYVTDFHGRAS